MNSSGTQSFDPTLWIPESSCFCTVYRVISL